MRDESYFCRSEVRNIAEEKSTKQFFCQLFTTFFFFSRRFYKGKRKRVSPSQAFFLSPPCFEVVIHHFPKSLSPPTIPWHGRLASSQKEKENFELCREKKPVFFRSLSCGKMRASGGRKNVLGEGDEEECFSSSSQPHFPSLQKREL